MFLAGSWGRRSTTAPSLPIQACVRSQAPPLSAGAAHGPHPPPPLNTPLRPSSTEPAAAPPSTGHPVLLQFIALIHCTAILLSPSTPGSSSAAHPSSPQPKAVPFRRRSRLTTNHRLPIPPASTCSCRRSRPAAGRMPRCDPLPPITAGSAPPVLSLLTFLSVYSNELL